MIHEFKIPMHDVNDETVILLEWYVNEGDHVNKGDALCSVETSKTVIILNVEESGYVKGLKCKVGDEIPVQMTICYIVDSLDVEIPQDKTKDELGAGEDLKAYDGSVTAPAHKLAQKFGLNLSEIKKKGIIREKDVLIYHKEKRNKAEVQLSVSGGEGKKGKSGEKVIQSELIKSIQNDQGFKNLSSDLKINKYKSIGAKIGNNVTIGKGSVIIAGKITIEDDVSIGTDTYIEGDEIAIGRMVRIGNGCNLVSGSIEVGDVTTIADRVLFDLSGGKSNSSNVIIGRQALVASEVYINSTRTVRIGNQTALSPRAVIYTHSYWQSVLEGYSADFDDVIIADNAWIGSAAQVMPGVFVGEGSIVISNSLVASNVAPYTMVGGIPASVRKERVNKDLGVKAKNNILASLVGEFIEYLKDKQCEISERRGEHEVEYLIELKEKQQKYKLVYVINPEKVKSEDSEAIYVGFNIENTGDNNSVFEMGMKQMFGKENIITNELRNYLRRRGIVFSPIYWRYDYKKGL